MGTVRLLTFDPGSFNTGVAVMDVDPLTMSHTLLDVWTLRPDKVAKFAHEHVSKVHGERQARLEAMLTMSGKMVTTWNPDIVISEAPYMSMHVQAFEALVECVAHLRRGCMLVHPHIPFYTIPPSVVKKTLGVKGNSGDKTLMNLAVRQASNIHPGAFDLMGLDEHSTDAIAVGYAFSKGYWSEIKDAST